MATPQIKRNTPRGRWAGNTWVPAGARRRKAAPRKRTRIPGLHPYGCMCGCQASSAGQQALREWIAKQEEAPQSPARAFECTQKMGCPCPPCERYRRRNAAVKTPDDHKEYIPLTEIVRSFDTWRTRQKRRRFLARWSARITAAGWAPQGMTCRSDHALGLQACILALVSAGLERGSLEIPRPSSRELGQMLGVSHQCAINYLRELEHHGFIRLAPAMIRLAPEHEVKPVTRSGKRKVARARRMTLVAEAYPVGVPVADSPWDVLADINRRLEPGERELTAADLQQARRDLEDRGVMECTEAAVPEKVGEKKWISAPATWVRHAVPVPSSPVDPMCDLVRRMSSRVRKTLGIRTREDHQVQALLTCSSWTEMDSPA